MRYLFFIFFVALTISCQEKQVKNINTVNKSDMNAVNKHELITYLNKESQENISSWQEYTTVNNNINKFKSISASEALNNALQFSKVVKHLKDSIRPKELLTPAFRTRVNVLENEALRLKDMTYISAITSKEVNQQIDKILNAFSATNSKINTVYAQLSIEKEIQTQSIQINSNKK